MEKSIKKTYFLWLFGGFFGLHHVYLGRDKQAFVLFSTLGGFLIGLHKDLYKIPEYIKEANEDKVYMENLFKKQSKLKAPVFYTSKFIGCVATGSFFCYLLKYCLTFNPDAAFDISYYSLKLLSPIGIALMVYLVGTEGPLKCDYKWPILGSYIAFVIDLVFGYDTYYSCAILSTMFLNWNIEWDQDYFENKKKRKLYKRAAYLSVGILITVSIFSLFLWNNAYVEIEGKKVTLKESVLNFLDSKEMVQLKEVFKMIWNYYQAHGLRKLINHFFYGYDAEAVANAYKIIEMSEKSSQQELESRCKKLAVKWHPDRFKVNFLFI